MVDWTFYTLADWWNPLAWTWLPEVAKREDGAVLSFLFFSIRGERQ